MIIPGLELAVPGQQLSSTGTNEGVRVELPAFWFSGGL
jgi:hypothetical protein